MSFAELLVEVKNLNPSEKAALRSFPSEDLLNQEEREGRLTHRVVAPQYSSNPATSRRLIERNRRIAKNSGSELSHSEDSNSALLKLAAVTSQKEQSRTAKNSGALLLKKVPTENTKQ
jgi:hypothetical protein